MRILLAAAVVGVLAAPAAASPVVLAYGSFLAGDLLLAGDACADPGLEGATSNCRAVAPSLGGTQVAFSARDVRGSPTSVVVCWKDATGATLACDDVPAYDGGGTYSSPPIVRPGSAAMAVGGLGAKVSWSMTYG